MIITIAAHKGGTGKSTTAAALAQGIPQIKKRSKTLVIDADAQGSTTKAIYGLQPKCGGLYSVIRGDIKALDAIESTPAGAILPYSPYLAGLDIELSNKPGRDHYLKDALEPLKDIYSHIIIDTAPGLGTCLIQALTASDAVIIPIQASPESVDGFKQIIDTIEEVKRYCNPALKIAGVVITQYQGRANLTKQYESYIVKQCQELNLNICSTRIRNSIAIQEAHALKENLFTYAIRSNGAQDYLNLIKELKF